MRLIDADALKKDIADNYVFTGFVDLLKDFSREIDGQPTVDAVEIVRCKDCEYRVKNHCNENYMLLCDDDDFCCGVAINSAKG